MKKYQKVLLIISGCLMIGGGIMGVAGVAMGGRPGFVLTDKGIQSAEDFAESRGNFVEKKVSLEQVKSLDLRCAEGDVEFILGDDFHLEYGYNDAFYQVEEEKKDGVYRFTGKYVKQIAVTGVGFFWENTSIEQPTAYLKVCIPKGTKLADLNLEGGYGQVKMDIEGTSAERATLNLESGSLQVRGLQSKEAEIQLSYGNLNLEGGSFENLTIGNEGGDCNLTDANAGNLNLKADYGRVELNRISAENVVVENESGAISIGDLTGKAMEIYSSYGDVLLDGITLEEKLLAEQETGKVQIDRVKAKEMKLRNESGNVEGSQVDVGEGSVELYNGECRITEFTVKDASIRNEYGEVDLELTGKEKEYSMNLRTEYGEVHLNGENRGTDLTVEREKAAGQLKVKNESGNIYIRCE